MATKLRGRAAKLYETDFYAWAEEQAARLRAREFDGLDLDNLIEEVEGLADTKLSGVLNSARIVMEHLLKLEHSPAVDPARPGASRGSAAAHVRDGARGRGCRDARPRRARPCRRSANDLPVQHRSDHGRLVAGGRRLFDRTSHLLVTL
jgi:hypothetical protein